MLDVDNSGSIEVDELHAALRFVGLDTPLDELIDRMKILDSNYDGRISYDEFIAGLSTASEWDMLLEFRKRKSSERQHLAAEESARRKSFCRLMTANNKSQKDSSKTKSPAAHFHFSVYVP